MVQTATVVPTATDSRGTEQVIHRLSAYFQDRQLPGLQIALLFGAGAYLRLAGLGYSDFQGDEIKALCTTAQFQSLTDFLSFLLEQRKGPVQSLVTCAYSIFDPEFTSELALRLPFALTNLLAMVCLFFIVSRWFNRRAALLSSFLFASNGIFVAFGRIVQYQSFVLLGTLAAILGLTLAIELERWRVRGLYLGFAAAAISLLAHFDAAFVLPPLFVLTVHWWLRHRAHPDFARLRDHLLAAAGLSAFVVLAFYLPYSARLGSYQLNYWSERFSGPSTDTLEIFRFYNPGPVIWVYLILIALGLVRLGKTNYWKPLSAWILPPLVFMELVFRTSRTHAYTYLLPLLIIGGLGLDLPLSWLERLRTTWPRSIAQWMVLATLVMVGMFSQTILVDHRPEYPWNPKHLWVWDLPGGNREGTFGFPYSRNWRDIGNWFAMLSYRDAPVVTNEKSVIPAFYLPDRFTIDGRADTRPDQVPDEPGIYFVAVRRPQSWRGEIWDWPVETWSQRLQPLAEFENEAGEPVATVFFLTRDQIESLFY